MTTNNIHLPGAFLQHLPMVFPSIYWHVEPSEHVMKLLQLRPVSPYLHFPDSEIVNLFLSDFEQFICQTLIPVLLGYSQGYISAVEP